MTSNNKTFWILLAGYLFCKTETEILNNENSIEMVVDVVKSFRQPYSVSIFYCNPFESIKLIKMLSNNGISASVHNTTMGPLPYPFPPNHAFFVLDLSCGDSFDLIMKANTLRLFSAPYKWLLLNAQERSAIENLERFEKIQVLLDSDVMISNLVSPEMYNISKMFKRKIDLPLVFYDFGSWTKRDRFYLHETMKWGDKSRKNLNGTNLKSCIVITDNNTLNHLTDRRHKLVDTLTKVNFILVQYLTEYVNANLSFSYENTWGYYNGNLSQWSGMIGVLLRGEAEIGGTALFMTSDRIPVVDFVTMPTPTKSKFVFRKPKLSYVSNVYVLPFHWTVWISTFFLIVITGFVLYGTVKCEWRIINQTVPNASNLSNSWMDVLFLALGATCQQGSSSVPNSFSGRFVTILLFLALMFLYTSYSANIVALLQSSSNTIRTLSDLLHSRLDVGVDDTVFNHFYFANAIEPIRRELYLQKVAPPGQTAKFLPIADGVRKIKNGYFAFHMSTGVGYQIVQETFEEHEKCDLQEIQFLQVTDPWLALQKNSSYKEVLKIGLRKLQENGLQARESSLMYTKKPVCANRSTSFISVSIIDCYLAACVLLGGIIFSFILFIVEIAVAHRLKIYQSAPEKLETVKRNHNFAP